MQVCVRYAAVLCRHKKEVKCQKCVVSFKIISACSVLFEQMSVVWAVCGRCSALKYIAQFGDSVLHMHTHKHKRTQKINENEKQHLHIATLRTAAPRMSYLHTTTTSMQALFYLLNV